MASISYNKNNGHRMIQFTSADGKRKTIRLGKCSERQAERLKEHVENLAESLFTGQAVEDETRRWVIKLDTAMTDRLARVGLVRRWERATLQAFIDGYIESRTDVKPWTTKKYRSTRHVLIKFFGKNKSLRDITPGDADEWRLHLLNKGLAENTVRKHTAVVKLFFNAAVRKHLIPTNPFAELKATIQPNPSRFYFITREEADKVLEACPDAEWRLIFALSRYGGLRCPSEHLGLRWGDIDWERERINVRSPKTEHHAGRESRVIPLFPELKPYLEEAFELAEPGTEFVITRYRDAKSNLRTQLQRIIRRAGLEPWPKLFQNLRSTRQTELEETFPSHVVCEWIGNSRAVAAKHYLQVTEDHFLKALQNALQQRPAMRRNDSKTDIDANGKTTELRSYATNGECLPLCQVAEAGLELAHRLPDTGF